MEIQYFMADPPHALSSDRMWCEEIASIYLYCEGRGLDIGAGGRTIRPGVERMDVDPDHAPGILGDASAELPPDGSYDFIYSGHCLEHIQDAQAALRGWVATVKPGGYVCLVLPDRRYTLCQNTDKTPHRHEWSPREFAAEVLDFEDESKLWFRSAPFAVESLGATVVEFTEACPGWSFCVVLRRDA